MKKILITICVAVGVYFAFSNTIDEFLYSEKRPGLNTYDTYTTTTQQTTTAVTQQTPIVTDEDGYVNATANRKTEAYCKSFLFEFIAVIFKVLFTKISNIFQ